jgi:hypothetical protein
VYLPFFPLQAKRALASTAPLPKASAGWFGSLLRLPTNAIPSAVLARITDFWVAKSADSPLAKDMVRHRTGVKQFEEHPKKYLHQSATRLYKTFTEAAPEVKVSQTKFEAMRPWSLPAAVSPRTFPLVFSSLRCFRASLLPGSLSTCEYRIDSPAAASITSTWSPPLL